MILSTRRARQRYVWARFFVREYALARGKRRAAPAASSTKGYETGTKWR